jgi:hypothetical protein
VPLGGLGELPQGREVFDLLSLAGVAVDQQVLAQDLAARDLGPDLGQREGAEIEPIFLDQPALLRFVDDGARRLSDVERPPQRAARSG